MISHGVMMVEEGGVELISSLLAAQRFIFVQTADQVWVEKLDSLLKCFHSLLGDFKSQIENFEQDEYRAVEQLQNGEIFHDEPEKAINLEIVEENLKIAKERQEKDTVENTVIEIDSSSNKGVENENKKKSFNKRKESIEKIHIAKERHYWQITKCYFCNILFKTIDELRKHDQGNHMIENKFVCPDEFCEYKHNKKGSVRSHFAIKHHDKRETCEICSANFRSKKRLNIHVQSQHNGERGWICEVCSKECKNKVGLNAHMVTHDKSRQVQCDYCEKDYSDQVGLVLHIAAVHKIGDEINCGECDKVFFHKVILRKHIIKNHTKKNLLCEHCDYRTSVKRYLNRHYERVHSEETVKNEICMECGTKFRLKGHLRLHERRVHKKVRKHKCNICQKAFFAKDTMICHLKIHTGETNFQCRHCDKQFIQKVNRDTHEKRVHAL